jgi:branched-chain amino acid transport system substrate-binding protein
MALARCPANSAALHRRLLLCSALVDPGRARKEWGELGALAPGLASRSRASAFRLGALLPDSGHYAPYARAVLAGIDAALADANSVSPHPIERRVWSTGGDTPERAAAALDSAGSSAGVLVGELLSVPTLAIASGARLLELPLVSPTATDEAVGRVGPSVFQVGPSGARRGEALAREVVKSGAKHIGILTADDLTDNSFSRGFAAAASAAGATVEWRGTFQAGTPDFRATSRLLIARKFDALFFDGDSRDAAALLRQLAKDQSP